VDGDVQAHRLPETGCPGVAQGCAAGPHRQRAVERPLRIVLVRDRRPEECQDGVAEEFRHEAAKAGDRLCQHLEQRILEGADLLRIEPLGQRREPGDVSE
jgi:hypothetical protein